jgi:hypothetical protein
MNNIGEIYSIHPLRSFPAPLGLTPGAQNPLPIHLPDKRLPRMLGLKASRIPSGHL